MELHRSGDWQAERTIKATMGAMGKSLERDPQVGIPSAQSRPGVGDFHAGRTQRGRIDDRASGAGTRAGTGPLEMQRK